MDHNYIIPLREEANEEATQLAKSKLHYIEYMK